MSSRVDTPKIGSPVPAGAVVVAGMAWAQPVGVQKVEVSIDNGEWQETQLSTPINDQSWVQWKLDWTAEAGTHYIAVRATDKQGNLQIQVSADRSRRIERVAADARHRLVVRGRRECQSLFPGVHPGHDRHMPSASTPARTGALHDHGSG